MVLTAAETEVAIEVTEAVIVMATATDTAGSGPTVEIGDAQTAGSEEEEEIREIAVGAMTETAGGAAALPASATDPAASPRDSEETTTSAPLSMLLPACKCYNRKEVGTLSNFAGY